TFTATIPLIYGDTSILHPRAIEPGRDGVLVIEDSDEDQLLYERLLSGSRFQVIPARSVAAAMTALDAVTPAAIILDIVMHGEHSWGLLARLHRHAPSR